MGLSDLLIGDDADLLGHIDLQLLLLATAMAPLGQLVLSPVLDSLIGPYGVSEVEIGLLLSAYGAPAIVMIPVAGILSDRLGRRPVLVGSLLLFGAAGSAMALTTDFRLALILRAIQGVGGGAIPMITITSVGDLYEGTREAAAQGFRSAATSISAAVFPFLAGLLVGLAWMYPLLLYAVAIPIGVLLGLWFVEPMSEEVESGPDGGLRSLLDLSLRTDTLAIVFARAMSPFIFFGFLTYNSIVVVRLLDGSPGIAGVLVAVVAIMAAVGSTQAGRTVAFFGGPWRPLIFMNLTLAAGLVLFAYAPTIGVAALGGVLVGLGFGFLMPVYRSIITGIAPEHHRGGLVSLLEAVARVASTAVPIIMGVAIGFGTPLVGFRVAFRLTALGVAAVGCLVAVGCVLLAERAVEGMAPSGPGATPDFD